ncbi:hypothetical protein V3H18_09590 [Methylocystis sp. 9N]|uniref:Uncharacterized protein n=1 Tax=Methylocystis borbori TaxID=3118750 RepID=A0ABU7XHB7_9HYPH
MIEMKAVRGVGAEPMKMMRGAEGHYVDANHDADGKLIKSGRKKNAR